MNNVNVMKIARTPNATLEAQARLDLTDLSITDKPTGRSPCLVSQSIDQPVGRSCDISIPIILLSDLSAGSGPVAIDPMYYVANVYNLVIN